MLSPDKNPSTVRIEFNRADNAVSAKQSAKYASTNARE
jgi:hypothetical protein